MDIQYFSNRHVVFLSTLLRFLDEICLIVKHSLAPPTGTADGRMRVLDRELCAKS